MSGLYVRHCHSGFRRARPSCKDVGLLSENSRGCAIVLGQRLKKLRESKQLSQGDIEKRTGLLRCYTSRVENGRTVPSVGTLEKYARALDVPMYRLFCDGEPTPSELDGHMRNIAEAFSDKPTRELRPFIELLPRLGHRERMLLMQIARDMASIVR